jgi:hypothetical protein
MSELQEGRAIEGIVESPRELHLSTGNCPSPCRSKTDSLNRWHLLLVRMDAFHYFTTAGIHVLTEGRPQVDIAHTVIVMGPL